VRLCMRGEEVEAPLFSSQCNLCGYFLFVLLKDFCFFFFIFLELNLFFEASRCILFGFWHIQIYHQTFFSINQDIYFL